MAFQNITNNKSQIINIYSINCDTCQKNIEVPIKKSDKESSSGGIFRIVAIHQCFDEQVAYLLFFDDHLALRQKVVTPVTIAGIQESDIFNEFQKTILKQYGGFNFLRKMFNKDLAKVIYGIILGQQVVIVGNKVEVEASIFSLELFAGHRNFICDSWIEEKSLADIIGTKPDLVKFYPNSIIVDLSKKEIMRGEENSYALSLLNFLYGVSDIETFEEIIKNEINAVLEITKEFILVEELSEIESYLSTLTLEEVPQEVIELVVALSAQLNHIIAHYYRSNYEIISPQKAVEIIPNRIWFFDFILPEVYFYEIKDDLPYNFKEEKILNRIKKLIATERYNLLLHEYFTPMNHYVIDLQSEKCLLFCFPRLEEDTAHIAYILKFLQNGIQNKHFLEQNNQYIIDQIKDNWLDDFASFKLKPELQILIDVREKLPVFFEDSILDSYYFRTRVCEPDFKKFITEIIDLILKEFHTEPKMHHVDDLYTLKGVISDLKADNASENEKIEIKYNLHHYINERGETKTVNLILDLYITTKYNQFGLETFALYDSLYKKFAELIKKAMNKCL
ncbi:MAG: hypothetical protein GNW80_03830 [Asgard group archaeon]|nr:hypothetical protein [Asgard group archaeon]